MRVTGPRSYSTTHTGKGSHGEARKGLATLSIPPPLPTGKPRHLGRASVQGFDVQYVLGASWGEDSSVPGTPSLTPSQNKGSCLPCRLSDMVRSDPARRAAALHPARKAARPSLSLSSAFTLVLVCLVWAPRGTSYPPLAPPTLLPLHIHTEKQTGISYMSFSPSST